MRQGTWHIAVDVAILLFTLAHVASATITLTDVTRKIDLRGNIELVSTTLRLRNDGDAAVSEFIVSQHPKHVQRVGDMYVATGGKVTSSSKLLSHRRGSLAHTNVVQLPNALAPGDEMTVTVQTDYRGGLEAVPPEIRASEDQYMRYIGSAHYYTPYKAERMYTTIALPSGKVASHTELPEPSTIKAYQVVMGPYTGVAGFTYSEVALRFRNNRGFLEAQRATLHYHVSHWGRLHVREEYELLNAAASLRGEWSRADYVVGDTDSVAHGDVWANLPADATGVVYADLIGNITTSRLRAPRGKKRPLQLTFRYPLMGGWRIHFWYTYDVLLGGVLSSAGDRHELTVRVLPTLDYDLAISEHAVRVMLPEGASGIEVVPHSTIQFAESHESVTSTMAYTGRPTVVLTRSNVRSRAPHQPTITVRYTFSRNKMLKAPATLISGLFAFFMVILIASRGGGLASSSMDVTKGEAIRVASKAQ